MTDQTLLASFELITTDASLRQQLSENIQRYAKQTFVTERYCQQLLSFIDEVRRQKPILFLTDHLSHYIQEIDPQNQALVQTVANEIAHLLPEPS